MNNCGNVRFRFGMAATVTIRDEFFYTFISAQKCSVKCIHTDNNTRMKKKEGKKEKTKQSERYELKSPLQ